ncbi:mobile element protein [Amycolatopsis vastitatis]|uniref:Mobile element protein n=1 Tax=Amycolatopsis vastitatis TaxID=1905142 RepID=A0A229TFA4_9PSEU|nr:mobile element protein [Amycolatopsis vastitatis]
MADDEIWLDGHGGTVLFLPTAPVLAVATVEVRGQAVTDYTWSRDGVLRRRACWPDELNAIRVVYTHGHDPIPDDVADAVLTEARYVLTVQPGVSAMTVGGESVSYTTPDAEMPLSWTTAVEAHRLNHGDQA